MPYSRVRIAPCYNARYTSVRAVLYSAASANPISIPIKTRTTEQSRNPLVEEAFTGEIVQPRIHDVQIVVRRGGRPHRFQIFVKNHKHLQVNAAVLALIPGRQWRGDILVMRLGTKTNGVVNLRTGDEALIRYMLRRFLRTAKQGPRLVLPHSRNI